MGGADPSPGGLRHVVGGGVERVGGHEGGAEDPVAVDLGHQADRPALLQASPEVVGELVGRHHQATGGPARGQADDGRLEVGHLQLHEPSGVAQPRRDVGQLVVEAAGEQAADPAPARGEGHGLGGVAIAEAVGGNQPRHIDPGVGPAAGGNRERDLVHEES